MATSAAVHKNRGFDPNTFLATIGDGRKILSVEKKQTIFAQGDAADAVFYVQKGKVRLTVVSKIGKEATIAIVGEGNFFGEGALAGQLLRMGSAAAMTDCEILRVDKKTMISALHREPALVLKCLLAYLLARNIRYEEDLVDQLFNSAKRGWPASFYCSLISAGRHSETVVPKISQETLAEMVGTTRSRVSFFMNRFRKLGFIDYAGGDEGGLQVHSSLLMSFCTIKRLCVGGFRMPRTSHDFDAYILPFNREKNNADARFGCLVLPMAARYADCSHRTDLTLL